MSKRDVILRHSVASIIALALFGGSRFLYNIIISRKFGLNVLGSVNSLISQAFLIAGFLAFFSVGLGKYTAEFLGRGEKEKVKSIASLSFMSPLLGLSLIPLNPGLAILATLRAIQLTLRSFIYGMHKGEFYAYLVFLGFLGFLLGFAFDDPLAPYYLLLGAVSVAGVLLLLKWNLLGRPRKGEGIILLRYSWWAFLGSIAGIFLIQGPYFMTEKLSSQEEAGLISAILSTSFLLSYLPQIVQSAIVPIFAYDFGKGELSYSRKLATLAVEVLSTLTGITVFLMLIFQPLIEGIFRVKFGSLLLPALIAVEIYIAYNPLINLLSATKFIKNSALYALTGSLVSLILWIALIPTHGSFGTLIGLVIGYSTVFILVLLKVHKEFAISFNVALTLVLAIGLQVLGKVTNPILGLLIFTIIKGKRIMLFLRDIRSL